MTSLSESIAGDVRPILLLLLSGAGLLLLIAGANVVSLMLVRTESRRREIAVRGALGASPARLARQFIIGGLVLVSAASVLGLIAASWAMQLLAGLVPADVMAGMPYLSGLGLNLRVGASACAISLLTAGLVACAPISRLSLSGMWQGLADGGRGAMGTMGRRFGGRLVVLELAVAMVLLVGAGLLGKSFYRLLHVELGFQPDRLAVLRIAAPETQFGSHEQVVARGREIVSNIASLPGVTSVSIASLPPVSFNGNTDWIRFEGRPYSGGHIEVNQRDVSSGHFTTLHATMLRGRLFTDADDASKPRVAIINRKLAKLYFPSEDPIGKRFGDTSLTPGSTKEIIGIVDDIKEGALNYPRSPCSED